ncbi:MAG: phosphate transport system regulatory protein PhoU [Verrucomicrobia bacterium CAG:312_58_20]|nr:MAG: phosphate transport system regulatory protein PhoU [Verrucomicrobia bacterium CAG:312_58_20]PWL69731.1 MAG: phosphate transport system regulatory protein PhoU [Verrucomicrobiota bacterium]
MNAHLVKDLDKLKAQILRVAAAVEENVRKSVRALRELSAPLAEDVVYSDRKIDEMEVETEEECLKILALHQPVASDLRFVITVLKINNELEHIGDMSANIARRVPFLLRGGKAPIPFDIDKMTSRTVYMLKSSIDAFLNGDEHLAVGVCSDDSIVDEENRRCYGNVASGIAENPEAAMVYINYLLVSKSLERIADLCTNIAEDVIYMKRSLIVRHNLDEAAKIIKMSPNLDGSEA